MTIRGAIAPRIALKKAEEGPDWVLRTTNTWVAHTLTAACRIARSPARAQPGDSRFPAPLVHPAGVPEASPAALQTAGDEAGWLRTRVAPGAGFPRPVGPPKIG